MNWLNNLFSNAEGETPLWGIALSVLVLVAIAAVIAAAVVLIVKALTRKGSEKEMTPSQWTARQLVFGALCIAIAFALSFLKFFQMPQGGSITPASMLPIMVFAYVYGTPKGLIAGLAYGLLQLLQDAYVVHWAQFVLDYMLAFMALALAGLFRKSLLPGILAAGLGRLFFAFLSGMIFFGQYAPPGQSPALYSFIYNVTYVGPETVICLIVALVPGVRKMVESFKASAVKMRER